MSFSKGYTQGGSNADIVIADAFVKNLTEGVDWNLAYEAVISDAEGKQYPADRTSQLRWLILSQLNPCIGVPWDAEISTAGASSAGYHVTTVTL